MHPDRVVEHVSFGGLPIGAFRVREIDFELGADALALDVEDVEPGVVRMRAADTREAQAASVRAFQAARRGKGARKLDQAFLEGVANLYDKHQRADPIDAIAAAYGVKVRSAQHYVTQARKAGILPETDRGKKGKGRNV